MRNVLMRTKTNDATNAPTMSPSGSTTRNAVTDVKVVVGPPPSQSDAIRRRPESVGEHRHRHAGVAAEEHRAGDGRCAEPLAHAVERTVEVEPEVGLERELELSGVDAVEVADRDADEREPVALDGARHRGEEAARRGEDRARMSRGSSQRA